MPASEWERRAAQFAFLGNSLLAPMTCETALGLDEAFWDGFALGGGNGSSAEGAACGSSADGVAAGERAEDAQAASPSAALARLKAYARGVRAEGGSLEDAVRRVNVEYARLFIGPPKPAAPPWETLYAHPGQVGEIGFGRATAAMQDLLAEAGLALAGESNQYADHAGLELLYLSELCQRAACAGSGAGFSGETRSAAAPEPSAAERASAFAREHPALWLPVFCARVAKAAPHGYYRGIAELAAALCAQLPANRPSQEGRRPIP